LKRELEAAVRRFFSDLDSRDEKSWLAAFAPGSQIVHDDGCATSPRALARDMRRRAPARPARALGRFRFGGGPALAWVAYENRVAFPSLPPLVFQETALLRRTAGRWRFVRIHYSGRRHDRP